MVERRCPKCGAAVWARGRDYAIYECESEAIEGEDLEETTQCLRNQLSQVKKRIAELARERDDEAAQKQAWFELHQSEAAENAKLRADMAKMMIANRLLRKERDELRVKLDDLLSQSMDEAEAKLATRPPQAVVGELQAENRRLREALEIAKRYVTGPHPNYGLDRVRDDYGIIEQALEVQGCD